MNGRRTAALPLAVLLLGAFLLSPTAPAQETTAEQPATRPAAPEPGSAAPELFVDVIDVDVVNLEVVVTDAQGRAITGLTRDDFVVLEDGEAVELSNFYAVETGQRVLTPEEATVEGVTRVDLPSDQRLNLAVLVDNAHIRPQNRRRVLDALQDHLETVLRPGDRMLVATLEPGLRILQPLTGDVYSALHTLSKVERSTRGQMGLDVRERQIYEAITTRDNFDRFATQGGEQQDDLSDVADRVLAMIRSYAQEADFLSRQTYRGLTALSDSLAGLPGRRAVLYVSEGFAPRPAQSMLEQWFAQFEEVASQVGVSSPEIESRRHDSTDELQRVSRRASGNRVTFYTLDAAGARTGLANQALGSRAAQPGFATDLSPQDPLLFLASATGGSSLLGAGDPSSLLERMADDHTDYYSLGYSSPASRDGRYHRIEVRVKDRRDLVVRHPEGYRGKDSQQRMTERVMSALLLDSADNPLEVGVHLGDEETDKEAGVVLPVLVTVPLSKLVLVPQAAEHQGRITIYVAVQDDEGRVSEPQRIEVPVTIPNDQLVEALGRNLGYGVNLRVRRGESKLAVGVRDELSAVESTINLRFSVGKS
ncbi:MAG TPA: VWA domain-containing protein [Thermoanaerobaculia bacterium]|nr:VWA domain-containing protein [Thermoanaerobaculia bacterium]